MDSRMLEVAIGLALVFALFGLLVTSIHEWIAQMMKSRGKTLRLAVTSLLADDADLADELMKQPLLTSMAEGNANSTPKPSYLSADVFVTSLIAFLTKKYLPPGSDKPPSPAEFVTRLQASLPPNLHDSLKTLLPGAETDWPAFEQRLCAWYNAVGERATGWYKRSTQRDMLIIGTIAAVVLNVNPIVIGPRLWDDDMLRKSMVTAGEQASKAYDAEQAKGTPGDPATAAAAANAAATAAVTSVNAQARPAGTAASKVTSTQLSRSVEEQLAQIKQSLERAGASALDAKPGDATGVLLLALNEHARLVRALDDARLAGDGSIERQRTSLQGRLDLEAHIAALRKQAPALAAHGLGEELPAKVDSLKLAIDKELKEREGPPPSSERKPPGGNCDQANSDEARKLCQRVNDLNSLQLAGLPIGWSPLYLPNVVQSATCKRVEWTSSRLQKQSVQANEQLDESPPAHCSGTGLLTNPNIWLAVLGWLLTGLAGTLGGAFWFDLLTRFVKLRSAGGKPDTGGAGGSAPASSTAPADGAAPTPGAGGVMTMPAAPTTPSQAPASSDVLNAAEAVLTTAEVEEIQRALKVPVTGYFNGVTRDAIAQYQRDQGLESSGELSAAQIAALLGRPPLNDGDGFVG
ncbi:MAG TPA: peptidoglycan-binding protein [Roseateles sp.]